MYYTNSYTSSHRKPLNFVQWYKKLVQIIKAVIHKGSLNIIKLCLLLIILSRVRDRERDLSIYYILVFRYYYKLCSWVHLYITPTSFIYTSMVRCALSKCYKSQCKRSFWRTIPRADTIIYQGLSKREVHQSYHTTVTYMPHGFEDEYLLA